MISGPCLYSPASDYADFSESLGEYVALYHPRLPIFTRLYLTDASCEQSEEMRVNIAAARSHV